MKYYMRPRLCADCTVVPYSCQSGHNVRMSCVHVFLDTAIWALDLQVLFLLRIHHFHIFYIFKVWMRDSVHCLPTGIKRFEGKSFSDCH